MTFVIIFIVVIIIFANSGKKKQSHQHKKSFQATTTTPTYTQKANTSNNTRESMDQSIIDVTGQSFSLSDKNLSSNSVPYWRHQYVYSYSEINSASNEQRRFYKTYKANFLNGIYMDIDGNTNYAFVLLFDLLNEYDNHKDTEKLEKQLKELGLHYPRTKSYCTSFLIKKFDSAGKIIEADRIRQEENYYTYDENYYKLGSQYKTKLSLSNDDIALLNKLWNPSNNFFNIEFCGLEIVKFYLQCIKRLNEKYQKESSTLETELGKIADIVARKHFNFRKGNGNYTYSLEAIISELHSNIFRYCENKVREFYGHKRKLNTDLPYASADAKSEYQDKLIVRLEKILAVYAPTLQTPDRATEIELNAQNPTRWKVRFDELTAAYADDFKSFVSDIVILGNLNRRNAAVENIFYEASKFIASHDKESALKLYVYYLHYDLKSVKFDNKQLSKTVQKGLFKNNEQLQDFQIIINNLISDQDLDKALTAIPKVYQTKRKKITLDRNTIQQVHEKHSGTVELLNEYLKDEDDTVLPELEVVGTDEVIIEINHDISNHDTQTLVDGINLSTVQRELLQMFYKSNLSVDHQDIESFSKSKGMFKNQLIDSVNEACYEVLDDVLIEEEEDYYIINENYYQTILSK